MSAFHKYMCVNDILVYRSLGSMTALKLGIHDCIKNVWSEVDLMQPNLDWLNMIKCEVRKNALSVFQTPTTYPKYNPFLSPNHHFLWARNIFYSTQLHMVYGITRERTNLIWITNYLNQLNYKNNFTSLLITSNI